MPREAFSRKRLSPATLTPLLWIFPGQRQRPQLQRSPRKRGDPPVAPFPRPEKRVSRLSDFSVESHLAPSSDLFVPAQRSPEQAGPG